MHSSFLRKAFLLGFLTLLCSPAAFAQEVLTIDSDEALVEVSFEPGQLVDLGCKIEPGQKAWVTLEAPLLYPGTVFARPSDEYCQERGSWLFPFSVNGALEENAGELFHAASAGGTRVHLGVNNLSGLGSVVVTTWKGQGPEALETIQRIVIAPAGSGEILESEKARDTAPDATPEELQELVEGNTAFALEFYRRLKDDEGNLFFSPYSISLALAMTYAGARGETEAGMAEALSFTLGQDRLHPAFNALGLLLESRGQGAQGSDGEGFRLNIANALWGQKDYGFLPELLDTLAVNYGAGMRLLDFVADPEGSRLRINGWVSDETEGKIENLIPQGFITALTRLVLTNAVYFNAAWAKPFEEEATVQGVFHGLDGGETDVPMMNQTERFPYAEGDGYQALELPYDGQELSMLLLLPREGAFRDFEGSLDPARLKAVVEDLGTTNVRLSLPKFEYEAGPLMLRQILSDMGMGVAFGGDADFSGMDGTRSLSIAEVIHKGFVSVDEAGTEAAAATAVVMELTSIPGAPVDVVFDRPFLFLIRDRETGAVLFLGRVASAGPR